MRREIDVTRDSVARRKLSDIRILFGACIDSIYTAHWLVEHHERIREILARQHSIKGQILPALPADYFKSRASLSAGRQGVYIDQRWMIESRVHQTVERR